MTACGTKKHQGSGAPQCPAMSTAAPHAPARRSSELSVATLGPRTLEIGQISVGRDRREVPGARRGEGERYKGGHARYVTWQAVRRFATTSNTTSSGASRSLHAIERKQAL